jgi:hypothetical protein
MPSIWNDVDVEHGCETIHNDDTCLLIQSYMMHYDDAARISVMRMCTDNGGERSPTIRFGLLFLKLVYFAGNGMSSDSILFAFFEIGAGNCMGRRVGVDALPNSIVLGSGKGEN